MSESAIGIITGVLGTGLSIFVIIRDYIRERRKRHPNYILFIKRRKELSNGRISDIELMDEWNNTYVFYDKKEPDVNYYLIDIKDKQIKITKEGIQFDHKESYSGIVCIGGIDVKQPPPEIVGRSLTWGKIRIVRCRK
jgi:hypothetical protein